VRLTHRRLEAIVSDTGLRPASVVIAPVDGAGPAISLEPERPLYPASMIKVPLVAALLDAVAEGSLPLSLETRIDVTPENMTANDGESPLQLGYSGTLHELMHLAITRSDNVATNVLFDVAGRERATDIAQQRLGLNATAFHRKLSGSEPLIDDPQWDGVHRNTHPTADAARLFDAIAGDRIARAGLLREMLAAQEWNEKLSAGLRETDRFLHKTGDTDEVTHDGGILLTGEGRSYVVVAYTGLPSNPEHNARFAPFMRAVRELL
jgi:beta-lactamase class A